MTDFVDVMSMLTRQQCKDIAELMAYYRKPMPQMLLMLIQHGIADLKGNRAALEDIERARRAGADI